MFLLKKLYRYLSTRRQLFDTTWHISLRCPFRQSQTRLPPSTEARQEEEEANKQRFRWEG
eukprot:TRINITY_DN2191_c0_g1_i1.p1 TRINITY_DN2191_c0_g1~~TRINITY_DN2191_c0_g1_i1.p1  ORF type:complete len:60 (+),score=2.68 TRINITY_DN2191_c0_g1_i1:91-270(+)